MNKYDQIVEAAKQYIERNIEHAVSPDDVAKGMSYSLKQLNRIFSMSTGITVGEYIRWSKLVKSLLELKYTDEPIIDIALKYGYESQESYTRAIKDNFSLNPGEANGLRWSFDTMPIFEDDNDETGYILFFTASDLTEAT